MLNSKTGVIKKYEIKGVNSIDHYREGCEIWSPTWGRFMPEHYQQERGGSAKFETDEASDALKVKVESKLGNSYGGGRLRGWCINNWMFREDSPLITCLAEIGGADKTTSLNLFKKYICFKPGFYTHWACKIDGEIFSGLLGLNKLKTPFVKSGVGYWTNVDCKWVSFFNKTTGFGLISLGAPEKSKNRLAIWQSGSMEELLYDCRSKEQNLTLNLGYLGYSTSPEDKWAPMEEVTYLADASH